MERAKEKKREKKSDDDIERASALSPPPRSSPDARAEAFFHLNRKLTNNLMHFMALKITYLVAHESFLTLFFSLWEKEKKIDWKKSEKRRRKYPATEEKDITIFFCSFPFPFFFALPHLPLAVLFLGSFFRLLLILI